MDITATVLQIIAASWMQNSPSNVRLAYAHFTLTKLYGICYIFGKEQNTPIKYLKATPQIIIKK